MRASGLVSGTGVSLQYLRRCCVVIMFHMMLFPAKQLLRLRNHGNPWHNCKYEKEKDSDGGEL